MLSDLDTLHHAAYTCFQAGPHYDQEKQVYVIKYPVVY